eukprot:SAG31_NODE_570_length_14016_cov_10.573543_6_plen_69_part_00
MYVGWWPIAHRGGECDPTHRYEYLASYGLSIVHGGMEAWFCGGAPGVPEGTRTIVNSLLLNLILVSLL